MTLAAYWGVGRLPFLEWDDQVYVSDNDVVRQGMTWEGVRWAFTTEHAHNRHPITWLSHMVDCGLFGPENASAHHRVNLGVHAVNVLLLFAFWRRATGALWRSALVAALFAVHPLGVESVAWIAERKNVLSTLFWLAALHAYLTYARRQSLLAYAALVAALVCGLLTKQMLVTLPCGLLLLDYWPLDRWGHDLRTWRRRIAEKLPLFALVAVASYAVVRVQELARTTWEDLPLGSRLGNAALAYVAYLRKTLAPFDLAPLYLHPRGSISWPLVAASLALLAVMTILVLGPLRRRRYLMFGWLWYLGTLVPVLGLIQVGEQAMADRYTYVPLIGIYVIVAWLAGDLIARAPPLRVPAIVLAALFLVILVSMTARQTHLWRGMLPLWQHAVEVEPENYKAHLQVGLALRRQGDDQAALAPIERAIELEPAKAALRATLAETYWNLDDREAAAATIEVAVAQLPEHAVLLYWQGALALDSGQAASAVSSLRRALALMAAGDESIAEVGFTELDVRRNLALALAVARRDEEVVAEIGQLLDLAAGDAELLAELQLPALIAAALRAARERALQGNLDDTLAAIRLGLTLASGQDRAASWVDQLRGPPPPDDRSAAAQARRIVSNTSIDATLRALAAACAAYQLVGDAPGAADLAAEAHAHAQAMSTQRQAIEATAALRDAIDGEAGQQ